MHNFENFAKVKFRDILLTGTGHRDRRLSRDCPGQTGTYGRSTNNKYRLRYNIYSNKTYGIAAIYQIVLSLCEIPTYFRKLQKPLRHT